MKFIALKGRTPRHTEIKPADFVKAPRLPNDAEIYCIIGKLPNDH